MSKIALQAWLTQPKLIFCLMQVLIDFETSSMVLFVSELASSLSSTLPMPSVRLDHVGSA